LREQSAGGGAARSGALMATWPYTGQMLLTEKELRLHAGGILRPAAISSSILPGAHFHFRAGFFPVHNRCEQQPLAA
jgi:hypothetical protein